MSVFAATAGVQAPQGALLHRALRSETARAGFRDIPVDWFDAAARTWRPTAVAQAGGSPPGYVDIFVPLDDGVAMAPAPVVELRLALGQSDAVMRFWTIRYRLRLLRTLAATLSSEEADAVGVAADELAGAEAEMRDVWLTAYAHGIPPRRVRTLLRPSDVRIVHPGGFESRALAGRCPTGPGGVLNTALELYGAELSRVRAALQAAGLSPAQIAAHALPAALSVLLAAATAELLSCDPAGEAVALDPAVWGA